MLMLASLSFFQTQGHFGIIRKLISKWFSSKSRNLPSFSVQDFGIVTGTRTKRKEKEKKKKAATTKTSITSTFIAKNAKSIYFLMGGGCRFPLLRKLNLVQSYNH